MPRQLSRQDLDDILMGAAIFGCGGGGPVVVGKALMADLEKFAPVTVVTAEEVGDDDLVCVSAFVGSPDAAADAPFQFDAATKAFEALERAMGKKIGYVMPGEVGAGNSFIPMTVAARKGIPFVDVDGAGRAIPSLTQVTFASHDVPLAPIVLGNDANTIVFDVKGAALAEGVVRQAVSAPEFGQEGGLAFWTMNGKTMREVAIHGTLSAARELGQRLREAISGGGDPVKTVLGFMGGRKLFRGKIINTQEVSAGGFDTGQMTLKNKGGRELVIYNQNENLMVWRTDRPAPLAMAPDLICFIATDGTVFTNATPDVAAVKDKEVVVFGARAQEAMRDPKIVASFLALLRTLGYGGPYVPFD